MGKIKKNRMMFVFLIALILLVAACGEKAECKVNSDCAGRACVTAKCSEKKCSYESQANCCGNGKPDDTESGKSGNKCTCPQDHGKCEGKAKIKIGARTEDARYVKNFCSDENECVLGVEQSELQAQNFLDAVNSGFFKATSVVSYNRPFDVAKDEFELKISLDDTMKDIVLPVQITRIKILYSGASTRSELLISDIPLNIELNSVGQEAIIDAGINLDYKPSQPEETGSVKYSLDYSFSKKVPGGRDENGQIIYNTEVVRSSFKSATKPVFFFKSG